MQILIISSALIIISIIGIYIIQTKKKSHSAQKSMIEILENKIIDHKSRICAIKCENHICFVLISDGTIQVIHNIQDHSAIDREMPLNISHDSNNEKYMHMQTKHHPILRSENRKTTVYSQQLNHGKGPGLCSDDDENID